MYLSVICPKCGYKNKDNAKFCSKCGNKLESLNIGSDNNKSIVRDSNLNNENKIKNNGNNKLIIIAVTAIICVAIIAGTFLLLNSNGVGIGNEIIASNNSSTDGQAVSTNSSSSGSSSSSSSSSDSLTYAQAASMMSGSSSTVISNTFNEADTNNDGRLTGSEVSNFKYLAGLTSRTADTSNTRHVEASDQGNTGDGTTKTRYCTTHGRVSVGSNNQCPYCQQEGLDSRTVKGSTEYN